MTGVLIRQKLGNIFDVILKKNMYFSFHLCRLERRLARLPREKRIDETPQRSEEAQHSPAGKRASRSGNQRILPIFMEKIG